MEMSTKQTWEGREIPMASRSIMSRYAKPAHKKAAKVLVYSLTLDTSDGWYAASALWQARLAPQETATIAWTALRATEPELSRMVAAAALERVGVPLPTFGDVMSDATWWADLATAEERAAYAVACFNRFSPAERDEFRVFVEAR